MTYINMLENTYRTNDKRHKKEINVEARCVMAGGREQGAGGKEEEKDID